MLPEGSELQYNKAMVEIRHLQDMAEIRLCEDIQKQAWGMDEDGVVPAPHFNAVNYSGGMLAGSFVDGQMVGFIYGFLARHEHNSSEGTGLHSHMMAVIPSFQGKGLGRQLKWYQRDWCLERDINWVSWTYDPMQAANARLNLEHFAAYANHYKVNIYGHMDDALNRGMPTDRFLAWWPLQDPEVLRLKELRTRAPIENAATLAIALAKTESSFEKNLTLKDDIVTVEIPKSLLTLMQTNAPKALEWRLQAREVFLHYFEKGYTAKRFLEGKYLLFKDG